MAKAEGMTVLVVDDEEDVREYLCDMLVDAGFRVQAAADGVQALEQVRKQAPDFISLDLVMPNKSGIRFLYELRRNPRWAKIPFIVVTAHAHDEEGSQDLQDILGNKSISGPRTYLEKPVDPDTYVRAVCERLQVEPETAASGHRVNEDKLREEVERLVSSADAETLAHVLGALKRKG